MTPTPTSSSAQSKESVDRGRGICSTGTDSPPQEPNPSVNANRAARIAPACGPPPLLPVPRSHINASVVETRCITATPSASLVSKPLHDPDRSAEEAALLLVSARLGGAPERPLSSTAPRREPPPVRPAPTPSSAFCVSSSDESCCTKTWRPLHVVDLLDDCRRSAWASWTIFSPCNSASRPSPLPCGVLLPSSASSARW